MSYQYATTHGSLASFYVGECEREPDDPVEPSHGSNWELVGSAASGSAASNARLYWFWRMEVPKLPAEKTNAV